jgi:hypothetical protein
VCLIPKIIPFACLLAQFGTPIVLDAKAERAFAPSASPVPPEPSPKGRHSNPIASGTQRAAPAAPFSRLNPNRPDSGLIPHIGAIPPGRFRLSPNVIHPEFPKTSLCTITTPTESCWMRVDDRLLILDIGRAKGYHSASRSLNL